MTTDVHWVVDAVWPMDTAKHRAIDTFRRAQRERERALLLDRAAACGPAIS